jgi:uncharacterized protein
MKELLEYIVKNLVSNPEAVVVEEENQEGNVNLYLTVDSKDMGIVIGKGGQTIHSLRKILTVRAISENVRVNLQLTEPEGGQGAPVKDLPKEEAPAEESTEEKETEKTEEENEEEKTEEDSPKEEAPEEGEKK